MQIQFTENRINTSQANSEPSPGWQGRVSAKQRHWWGSRWKEGRRRWGKCAVGGMNDRAPMGTGKSGGKQKVVWLLSSPGAVAVHGA